MKYIVRTRCINDQHWSYLVNLIIQTANSDIVRKTENTKPIYVSWKSKLCNKIYVWVKIGNTKGPFQAKLLPPLHECIWSYQLNQHQPFTIARYVYLMEYINLSIISSLLKKII